MKTKKHSEENHLNNSISIEMQQTAWFTQEVKLE